MQAKEAAKTHFMIGIVMVYSLCTGVSLVQVQGIEPELIGPNILYRSVHTGLIV